MGDILERGGVFAGAKECFAVLVGRGMENKSRDEYGVDDLRREEEVIASLGDPFPGSALAAVGEKLRSGPGWPELLAGAPMIIDTDIGGDPDDALALAVAALSVPELTLVLTNDETGGSQGYGHRARFARWLLDSLGRTDVEVVSGGSSGWSKYFCVENIIPRGILPQSNDVVGAVQRLLERSNGPVRWVGIGALTNLARVLRDIPGVVERIRVTQMGGALRYRDPSRAEHNVRIDVGSAREVFDIFQSGGSEGSPLSLVTSDVTFNSSIEVTRGSRLYEAFSMDGVPTWASILKSHMDYWFSGFHSGTIQHDALALSVALEMPFIDLDPARVALDEIGRMSSSEDGTPVWLSVSAEYGAFNSWMESVLIGKNSGMGGR